jgi:hypothetical protein
MNFNLKFYTPIKYDEKNMCDFFKFFKNLLVHMLDGEIIWNAAILSSRTGQQEHGAQLGPAISRSSRIMFFPIISVKICHSSTRLMHAQNQTRFQGENIVTTTP